MIIDDIFLFKCPVRSSTGFLSPASIKPPKVQEQEEIDDETIARDAKFAFQTTDLEFTKKSLNSVSSRTADETTDRTFILREAKHWALVVHFPKTEKTLEKTYKFDAGQDDKGYLVHSRHDNIDQKVFEKAMYFGTAVTSPRELLEKADQASPKDTKYHLRKNNCQTWSSQFLNKVSPDLYKSFGEKLYEVTRSRIPDLVNQQFLDRISKK